MALRHRARSVYSLSLPQETALDESNPVPVISPLDKEYLAWLGNTTSNLWPLIRIHDDQLAQHILEQNFNPAITASGRILGDRSALTSLCGKYGPLGHDTTFALVSETAWVASYRQHYVFEGPDAVLLDHLAHAFAVIKTNLKEADRANDHLFDTTPTNSPPRSPHHQHMMRNGIQPRFQEHETNGKENGAPSGTSQRSLYDNERIDEEVEDDDRDDDDELYEDAFDFEDSGGGSYGANGHSGQT